MLQNKGSSAVAGQTAVYLVKNGNQAYFCQGELGQNGRIKTRKHLSEKGRFASVDAALLAFANAAKWPIFKKWMKLRQEPPPRILIISTS